MTRAARLAILALPLFSVCAAGASTHHIRKHVAPAGIGVAVDEAKLVSFERPVKTVFVGNPSIADVSMVDPRHAFVLGKTMGLTNLIVLDANGAQVENKQVMVTNTFAAATLNRGPDQFNYTCSTSHCEVMPRPGDPKKFFDDTELAAQEHEEFGGKSASAPSGVQPLAPPE
jgi:hypothetical protein